MHRYNLFGTPAKSRGFQMSISKIGKPLSKLADFWRYRPDLNWGIKVLQTFALPLGHGTI